MSRNLSSPPRSTGASPGVVAINDAAASYLALAEAIAGAAVGLSPEAQALLRRGLVERFGAVFNSRGDEAVDELLRLATRPKAA